jgi:hypothetical protein
MRRYPYETSTQSRSRSRTGTKKDTNPSRTELSSEALPPTDNATKSRGRTKKTNRGGHSRSLSKLRGIEHIVEDDISMVMRRRCLRGYSIGNVRVFGAIFRFLNDSTPFSRTIIRL